MSSPPAPPLRRPLAKRRALRDATNTSAAGPPAAGGHAKDAVTAAAARLPGPAKHAKPAPPPGRPRVLAPAGGATSLRALAIRVAATLKRLGPCSYGDVADALVRDGGGGGGGGGNGGGDGGGGSGADALSVRRRVNDALNVLVAAGVATRGAGRVIAWNWVFGAEEGVREAFAEIGAVRARVLEARARRDALEKQVRAFESVVARNAGREMDGDPARDVVRFPFVLVSMDHAHAACDAIADDASRSSACITMSAPFQILDDCAVLERVAGLPQNAHLPDPVVTWPSDPLV